MFEFYKGSIILKKDRIECKSLKKFVEPLKAAEALAVTQYVFLLMDRSDDNPVKDLKLEERLAEAESVSEIHDKCGEKIISKLEDVCAKYALETSNKIQGDIDVYTKKMFEYIDLLDKTEPVITRTESEKTDNVYYSSNISIITDTLNSIMKIIIDKAQMVGMQKSGKFIQSLRGGLSPNMKGKTTQIKN